MKWLLTTMRSNRKHLSCLLFMVCSIFCTSSFAGVQGQPSAFTLDDHTIGAFVTSDSGRLFRVVLDFDPYLHLNSVAWEDLGGTQLRPSVTAIDPWRAYVIGGDGNLYLKYWDGNAWQWSFRGNPGVTLSGNISVISGGDAFVVGDDNSLYKHSWSGQWFPLGGTALTHYVSAVEYADKNKNLQMKVYVVGGDGNLYVKYWDGNAWQWGFVGRPHANVTVAWPSIAGPGDYHPTDRAFVVGSDGHLYAWDVTSVWVDMGGSQLANPPAKASIPPLTEDEDRVFIVGGNGRLYGGYYSNVGTQYWTPGGCSLKPLVSPIYVLTRAGNGGYYAFVIGSNGRFYVMDASYSAGPFCDWYGYDLSAFPGAP